MSAAPAARPAAALLASAPAAVLLSVAPAAAHFQEILPSADVLPEGGAVTLALRFTHPVMGGPQMDMARPQAFGMWRDGADHDLLPLLKRVEESGTSAWTAEEMLPEPGAAIFHVTPAPYWEAAEGKFIVHYTKVVVDSWASGEGWDVLLGLPVEIAPLTRPTGLWAGNLFRGVVMAQGAPVPFAEVEVEFVNDGRYTIPNDAFSTQVIKADANGTFAYAMPFPGWWGFAALTEGPEKMRAPDGSMAPVEEGGLIWVKAAAPEPAAD
ncbi:DUF4198 domain-containing protein (plasmid) [Paroceanicella profunda]|uniref:DUF4198 domain-containing protein n=1 Tax=Paroceanicella profunda TaxID=2579971 RepID=A0A5B8FJB7_9RHOB|nr:DUF4198 domain-containing protein [Paroceanicella profunda]QDL94277.1 DUF4198 domain-containing protein [Paroceanicella profunda]